MPSQAQGFLLLTLDGAHLTTPTTTDTGTLWVECITLRVGAEGRDVWLVLRVNNFEMPISPSQVILHARATQTFTFTSPTVGEVKIKIPAPSEPAEAEDLETLEVILSQYAAMQEVGSGQAWGEGDIKGRLVLVDEHDGEVVGTLADEYRIREDKALLERGHEKDPVIIHLPDEDEEVTELVVQPVPPDEHDFIFKTANFLSRGIVFTADALSSGMNAASTYYIAHSTPREKPVVFSETAKGRVRKVHAISGTAVEVTAKTTGLIHDAIGHAMDYVASKTPGSRHPSTVKSGVPSPVPSGYASPQSIHGVPPFPPRKGDPNVFPTDEKGRSRTSSPAPTSNPQSPPPLPPRRHLANRLLLSTDLLLTTLENSAKHLVEQGTGSLGRALRHKYGDDMAQATLEIGGVVRNVGVVYIDARGVGRRALLKTAGKKFVRAKLGKKDVVIGLDQQGHTTAMGGTLRSVNSTPLSATSRVVSPGPSEKGKGTVPSSPLTIATPPPLPPRTPPPPQISVSKAAPGGLGMGTNVPKSSFADGW